MPSVIFDFDGVLADSGPVITDCIHRVLVARGFSPPTTEQLLASVGPPLATSFARLTAEAIDSTEVAACVADFREIHGTAALERTRTFPGVREALAQLAPNYALAVATSRPAQLMAPLLPAMGLASFFEVVAAPDIDDAIEAKAVTIGKALDRMGHPEAVMVGDRSFDAIGAQAHDLPAIGVTWGAGSRQELEAAGADPILDHPSQLVDAVERALAARPDRLDPPKPRAPVDRL